jgi:hypothetical protein
MDFNSTHPNGLDGTPAEVFNSQGRDGVQSLKITMFRRDVAISSRVKDKGDSCHMRDGQAPGSEGDGTDGSG